MASLTAVAQIKGDAATRGELREDISLAAHGTNVLLKSVGILEAGARSVIVSADEQVARLSGVHYVVGLGFLAMPTWTPTTTGRRSSRPGWNWC